MKKFRFGFAFKSTLLVSILLFAIIFGVSLFVMESFYGTIRAYTENMLKVINKGFKQDYFDWVVGSINAYGNTITKNDFDEYNFFKDSIENSITIVALSENQSTRIDTGNPNEIFIVSPFYWDGEKLFSKDSKLQNSDFINLLNEIAKNIKTGEGKTLISDKFPYPTYIYRLKKGVIGFVSHPETYNMLWLKGVFKDTKVNFYALITSK